MPFGIIYPLQKRISLLFEVGSIAAGTFLGAGLASANRWWQYRRENWYSRITTFCDLSAKAADTASEYWLVEVDSSIIAGGPSKDLTESRSYIIKLECQIIGIQAQLDGLYGSFSHRLSFRDRPRLEELMRDFGYALNGGQFQVRDRKIDVAQARSAHALAGFLIAELRHSLDRAITLRGLTNYLIQRPHIRSSLGRG